MTPKKSKKKIPDILDRKDAAILRERALPVDPEAIKSKKIKDTIAAMNVALDSQEDGVAIAAPQIGVPLRIFIVSGRVRSMARGAGKKLSSPEADRKPNKVYINPELIKLSKKKRLMEEGCLSVRWLYGKVERSEKATIRAYDEHGKKFEQGASGLLAQAFQHETDHLEGILFIDKAVEIESNPPQPTPEITSDVD